MPTTIKEHIYSLFIKTVLLAALALAGSVCAASTLLGEPGLAWKNVSVLDKRMSVYCIFKDSRGIVWLGTNNGLFFYDGVTTHAVALAEMSMPPVYSIVENGGTLLLGTNSGLMSFSFRTSSLERLAQEHKLKEIRCMLPVGGKLWMGGIYGMYTYDLKTHKVENVSKGLPHKSVYAMLRDSRGILYAGTYDGLARWNPQDKAFDKVNLAGLAKAADNLFVNCLLETSDQQHIYIGTEGNLYRYTPLTGACEAVAQVSGSNIKSMAQSADGHLLVGTDNGVFDIHGNTVKRYRHDTREMQSLSNNEIWCIYSDRAGNVWAGHEVGFSLASNSNAIRTIKLSSLTGTGDGNDIHSIYKDSRGTFWINGTNGIIKLAGDGQAEWYRASDKPDALSHNHIRGVKEDSDGNVWFCTDGGLNRYNYGTGGFDVFRVVDKAGKHASNWVYALEEDNGHFIIGSYLGGLHYVSKSKFGTHGGTVVADQSTNTGAPFFRKSKLRLNNNLINKVIKDPCGNIWILCFNDGMLTEVRPDGRVVAHDMARMAGNQPNLITLDRHGRLWCAFKGGAAVFDKNRRWHIVRYPKTDGDESALAIEKVGGGVWVSTVSNMWSIDGKTLKVSLLPIPQKQYKSIYADNDAGKVYLGGNDEITEVTPRLLNAEADKASIKMLLADVGGGTFDLGRLLPGSDGLTIPYHGSLTLIVSNLDYSPGASQRYCYKLAKERTDTVGRWIIMPEDFNTISLPELKTGDYFILLKPVGTLEPVSALRLHVQPPWPLSWWAFCLYFMAIAAAMACIVIYMHRRNARILREEESRKALESVERKLTFLSNIAHDLKTPLSMIIGPASVLKEKAKDETILKGLETIYENAFKLNNMIHRTLEINSLEKDGENVLILSTFNVVDFCKNIFHSFKESCPQKKFVFYSSVPQLVIEADAVKFESVITNLLSNACKYSEDDATISCGINLDGGNVNIVVADDGLGITEADKPLVFQRMFRAPSTSKMREGTGIGLYLVKKYIELMNGKIELYSEKGQGTSFVITIPLTEKSAEEHAAADKDCADHKKPKVLIVEDNRQISEFIHDLLKDEYTCLSAGNGRTGLSIAASFIPDIIISDELMPVMNGTEMIRHLKQNARLANIPIIMLTANANNETEKESVQLGVDIFMPKPFEPSVLLGRIRHLLQMRAKMQEAIRIEAITEAKPIEAESVSEKLLAKISKAIEDNISDPDLNVNLVCEKCGIPNKQLYRLIKKYMNVAPLDYIRSVRLQKAAMLLAQKRFTVSEVCYMVGFKTPSYFAKCFQEKFGVKPSQYETDDHPAV